MDKIGCNFAVRFALLTTVIIIMGTSIFSVPALGIHPNEITFENQSGSEALVKLLGPTTQLIEVPNGKARTLNIAPGEYYILVRYGSAPGKYSYSKGEAFMVQQTTTEASVITITLHKTPGGKYNIYPTTKTEFEKHAMKLTTNDKNTSYFPLIKGNTWAYKWRRTDEAQGKNWNYFTSTDQNGKKELLSELGFKHGEEGTLQYTVGDHVQGEDGWFAMTLKLRGNEYRDSSITWGPVTSSKGGEKHNEYFVERRKSVDSLNPKQGPIIVERVLFCGTNMTNDFMDIKTVPYSGSVNVPAGRFTNVLQTVLTVAKGQFKLTCELYFADGVGLIKEVRKNKSDQITYTMELLEYKVTQ